MDRYPIGATARLDLTVTSSGVGVSGETPSIIIQRLSDNYYFDDTIAAPTSKFADAFHSNDMSEVDAVNLPGLYRYSIAHTEDETASEFFFVRKVNAGAAAVTEDSIIAFGQMASAISHETCNLYGTILDINNAGDVNKLVRVSILPNTIMTTGNKEGISVDRIDTYTDTDGAFSITLIRELVIRLQIPSIGYDRKVTIPDASSANFADL